MDKSDVDILYTVSVAAAEAALIKAGLKKATLTNTEAEQLYGEYKLRKWRNNGFIKTIQQGNAKNSQLCYSVEKLNKAALRDKYFKK